MARSHGTTEQRRARQSFFEILGERVAYFDEGPRDGRPIVPLHGMPTSSWLYRDVIARLANGGLRVIAPDMVGFGASSTGTPKRCEGWIFRR